MPHTPQAPAGRARAQMRQLLDSLAAAEAVIVTSIERECESLRAGRLLAAEALHLRLHDAARLYISAAKAVRTSLWAVEHVAPGSLAELEERRSAFAAVLKVELAVLAAERRDARGAATSADFSRGAPAPGRLTQMRAARALPAAPGPAAHRPSTLRIAR